MNLPDIPPSTRWKAIQELYPQLEIKSARSTGWGGQFNEILLVNERIVFRFPRSPAALESLRSEADLLVCIRNYLTLAVPEYIYLNLEPGKGPVFTAYIMLPGEPLQKETLERIDDPRLLDRLASQAANFLGELHGIPLETLGSSLPKTDGQAEWQATRTEFRQKLFPYMREDARCQIESAFERFISDPAHFSYEPALRHGDFGGSNILYDSRNLVLSGVIDFGFAGLGDPAVDLASVSTLGEAFFQHILKIYPAAEGMLERAKFYRSTFALQEALYGLRDGDLQAFENGMREYR